MKNILNKIKYGKLKKGLIAIFAFLFIFSSVASVSAAATFSAGTNTMPFAVAKVGTSNWITNITGVNAGEKLNLSTYYYTADTIATNAKATVTVTPAGGSNTYLVTSTLSADGFTDYVNTLTINLSYTAPSFTFDSNARWLHDATSTDANHGYNTIDTPAATISGNQISYDLGTVNPGYINDGYIEFYITFDPAVTPAPTANAGPDQNVNSGALVQLDGSASTGVITSYAWTCTGGIALSDATIVNPTFTAPVVGATTTYTCTLTVTNSTGSSSDSVDIVVNPTGFPIANAGVDQTVTSGNSVQLDGSASTGVITSYAWTCTGGIALSDATIVNPTFTAPIESSASTYTCTLTVTNTVGSSSDSMNVTVNPSSGGGGGGGAPLYYYDGVINAEILPISNNTGESVQLNAKITECENGNCSAKFNWGTKAILLEESTAVTTDLNVGDEFSNTINGLYPGETYYAELEINMTEAETYKSTSPLVFIAKPNMPENLSITVNGNNTNIEWQIGEGGTETLIKKQLNSCPTLESGSGEIVYSDTGTSMEDKDIPNGTYCYKVWTVTSDDGVKEYSDPIEKTVQIGTSTGGGGTIVIIKEPEEPTIVETVSTTGGTTEVVSTTPIIVEQVTPTISTPIVVEQVATYGLSVNTSARNSSFENLQWGTEIEALDGNEIEFIIEIENTGNTTLSNVTIKNFLDKRIEDIKDVIINDIVYPSQILENSYIKQLKAGEEVKITFSGTVTSAENGDELVILSEVSANQVDKKTSLIKVDITDNINFTDLSAGFFSTFLTSGWLPWIILIIIILILVVLYLLFKKKNVIKE
jgi:hypothetical protein